METEKYERNGINGGTTAKVIKNLHFGCTALDDFAPSDQGVLRKFEIPREAYSLST